MKSLEQLSTEIVELNTTLKAASSRTNTVKYHLGCALAQARSQLPIDNEFGDWCKNLDTNISRQTNYNLRQLPEFGTQEACELVGYSNVYKLSREGNESIREEVRTLVAQGYDKREIRQTIKEHFDALKPVEETDDSIELNALRQQLADKEKEIAELKQQLMDANRALVEPFEDEDTEEEEPVRVQSIGEASKANSATSIFQSHQPVTSEMIYAAQQEPVVESNPVEQAPVTVPDNDVFAPELESKLANRYQHYVADCARPAYSNNQKMLAFISKYERSFFPEEQWGIALAAATSEHEQVVLARHNRH